MRQGVVVGLRRAAAVAALAGIALLAAACGGSPSSASGASSPPDLAQALGRYAQCMRMHGEPGTSIASAPASPGPGATLMIFHGFAIQGVSPGSPQFATAMKACQHWLPHGTPPTAAELHQQFTKALQAARCMRSHGYPDWPDPAVENGHVGISLPPAGVDTNSPQFQAAAKACGGAVVMPPGQP